MPDLPVFRATAIVLAALALAGCSPPPSPAASAMPHGATPVTVESLIDAATTYVCPEVAPAQPNCRAPK